MTVKSHEISGRMLFLCTWQVWLLASCIASEVWEQSERAEMLWIGQNDSKPMIFPYEGTNIQLYQACIKHVTFLAPRFECGWASRSFFFWRFQERFGAPDMARMHTGIVSDIWVFNLGIS